MIRDGNREHWHVPLHVRKKSTDQSRRLLPFLLNRLLSLPFFFQEHNWSKARADRARTLGLTPTDSRRNRARGLEQTGIRPHFASSYNLNNIAYIISKDVCADDDYISIHIYHRFLWFSFSPLPIRVRRRWRSESTLILELSSSSSGFTRLEKRWENYSLINKSLVCIYVNIYICISTHTRIRI